MSDYDASKPSKFISYQDANNLYEWSSSQCLPTGGFKWLSQKKIQEINLATYTETSNKGLNLEVNLEYSSKLHDLHNDYPVAPEKIRVNKDMLLPYCKKKKSGRNTRSPLAK